MNRLVSALLVTTLFVAGVLLWPAGVRCYGQTTSPAVVSLDAVKLPAEGGTYPLLAGRVYTLAKTKTLACALVKQGAGPNPIIRYSGSRDSSALQVPADRIGSTSDVDFELARGVYAVNCSGTFSGSGATVRGGGGWLKAVGSTGMATLERWVHTDVANNYIVWASPALVKNEPPADRRRADGTIVKAGSIAYEMRPGRGVTLVGCQVLKGTTAQHVMRVHYVQQVRIIDCTFVDADRAGAVLRIHDVLSAELVRDKLFGDCSFGPMCEADGGVNEPPGAHRVYYDRMRLGTLSLTDCSIDAELIKLNPGILNFRFTHSTFSAHRSGALFEMPWPYMNRPPSRGLIDNCTLLYRGTNGDGGRAFGSADGSIGIRVAGGTTFNGKPLTK